MTDLVRLLLLVAIAGAAVTMFASWAAWWHDEDRRLRRLVRRSLACEPDAVIVAKGRNAAAGLGLDVGKVVVMWNGGAQALLYPLHALEGAELVIDGAVVGRVYNGEPRRTLDRIDAEAGQVTLRLIFDDPRDPDFDLDLWLPQDQSRRDATGPGPAIQEARSWLARVDAILRRAPPASTPAAASPAAVARPATEEPPWDEDDDLDEDDS